MELSRAKRRHRTVEKALKTYQQIGVSQPDQIWSELFGRRREGMMAESTRWTIRREHVCLLRMQSGVPAAFAFYSAANELSKLRSSLARPFDSQQDGPLVRRSLSSAWDDLEQRRTAARVIQDGFGCGEGPSWEILREVDADRESREVEPQVVQIAKLAGQMLDAFRYNRMRRECDLPQVIKDARTGRHLDRLLPSELAQLTDEGELGELALLRLVEGKALEYGMTGWDHRVRGPLVLALDESGSMDGERNIWAKACAIALTRIAHSEGRTVSVVHYATSTTVTRCEPGDELAKYRMARHWLDGGTAIAAALRAANDEIAELGKRGHPGGDIVLISDGEDWDVQRQCAALDEAEKVGTRLWSIAIQCNFREVSPLRTRAELYQHIERLDADAVVDLKRAALAK